MRILNRSLAVVALVTLAALRGLDAQEKPKSDNFRWFIGAQVGVIGFETPVQTYGTVPSIGIHTMIKARRTGLLISIDQGFSCAFWGNCDQQSAYPDAAAAGGVRQVVFHDIRSYSAVLLAFPVGTNIQPYLGVGFTLLHTVKEYPAGPFVTPDEQAAAEAESNSRGSYGAGTALVGLQIRVKGFAIFGQGQVMTSAGGDKLLAGGPPFNFSAGARISLGSSREGVSGGGY